MNVGSLFSGIGGLDHGLALAGHRHVFFCESDPWRRTVLAHHWPGVPIYEDVVRVGKPEGGSATDRLRETTHGGRRETRSGLSVDLLCGGFPCQDLSVAGRRRGLAGERSSLFYEYARIAESLRPRWLLIENVPGLLSSNGGRDFGIVLGTLADLGYGVAWRVLDSRFFGVPQRRRRVFIVGTVADGDPRAAAERAGEVLAVGTRCPGHPPQGTQTGEEVAAPLGSSPRNGREQGGPRNDLDNDTYVTDVSYALNGKRGNRDDGESETFVSFDAEYSNQGSLGDDKAVLTRKLRRAISSEATGVRRLTPTECERLQALPDGWTAHGPDSRRYAALGDAVTSSVAEWIGRRLMEAT